MRRVARKLAAPTSSLRRYREQFMYGHREILLSAAGLDGTCLLLGNIQHGFEPLVRYGTRPLPRYGLRKGSQWVWRPENAQAARSRGVSHVHAIGAPWLYLRRALQSSEGALADSAAANYAIFMPQHLDQYSTPSYHARALVQASQTAEALDAKCSLVILHAHDFMRQGIRAVYESTGIRVACAGWTDEPASNIPPWADIGDRAKFLPNLYSHFREHGTLITSGVGSHVMYAASLGMRIALDRDYVSVPRQMKTLEPNVYAIMEQIRKWAVQELPGQLIQDTHYVLLHREQAMRVSASMLGVTALREPDELRQLLVWREGVVPADLSWSAA